MVRLRMRAGVYISGILLLLGLALAAQATTNVTRSEMESFVLAALGGAGVVVFGAFWILLITISGRSEKALMKSVERLENAVAAFAAALAAHDNSPYAHQSASEHNHGPIEKDIHDLKMELDGFIRWCHEHQCPALPRNPESSPHPKRKTDSKDDYTPLRGKHE